VYSSITVSDVHSVFLLPNLALWKISNCLPAGRTLPSFGPDRQKKTYKKRTCSNDRFEIVFLIFSGDTNFANLACGNIKSFQKRSKWINSTNHSAENGTFVGKIRKQVSLRKMLVLTYV